MKLNAFIAAMNRLAPKETALSFDNCGLLIGTEKTEIKKVLVALDLSDPVADEAVQGGYDLVLTHHPVFLEEVKSFGLTSPETSAAYRLIRHGIGHFAAHTNLDACKGGVNDVLADLLPEDLGRVGTLRKPIPFSEFAAICESVLQTKGRFVGRPDAIVHRVAVIGGSGGGDLAFVHDADCDTFVTGEVKHHQALAAEHYGINCCVLGHYETEFPVLEPLITRLQNGGNDVQYDLTHTGRAPLRCL